ncbi:MAG: alpha/beta hydrolase [Desulfobacterales bacterium]|nr:alpha/beta hydrolase [Desulfobacterales bacterium]
MASESVEFENADGLRLVGRLERPDDGRAVASALFAHCFTCGKDIKAAFHISRALSGLGLGVLRFDFTGLGHSEGVFAETNFSSNVNDLIAAAGYMTARDRPPTLLIGHSLGGAAAIQAASAIASVRAVATIGTPATPAHVKQHLVNIQAKIANEGQAEVRLAGRDVLIKRQFLEDVDRTDMASALQRLDGALLIMHAPADEVVGVDHAARIYQMANHPKSFIALDGADHLLSASADARYAARLIAAWASRYLPPETPVSR